MASRAERIVVAAAVALALFGGSGVIGLCLHWRIGDWLLPACVLAGLAAAWCCPSGAAFQPHAPPHRQAWHTALGAAAAAAALLAIAIVAYGALATPSRHWDGAVAWDLKAGALTDAPTLEQPLFRDPAVYSHSRDYPLQQPLLMAMLDRATGAGRVLFPLQFAALLGAVWIAARRTHAAHLAAAFVAAAALTPMFVAPTSGAFDSGYADGGLAALLALAAAGLALDQPLLLAAASAAAVLQKPEGLAYGVALLAAVFWRGTSRAVVAATPALAGAGALSLALQHDLLHGGQSSILGPALAVAAVGAALAIAADAGLRRCRKPPRWRLALIAGAAAAAAAALQLLPAGSSLGSHLAPGRALARLDDLPRILLALGDWAWLRGRYGLAFVLPLLLLAATWRQRAALPAALWCWLALAPAVIVLPFLLSPVGDLEHHLRSSLPRLLMHWAGVAWVAAAATPWPAPPTAASPGT
jgi:hypothetical protein